MHIVGHFEEQKQDDGENDETIDENNILCMDELERLHITKALKHFRWDRKQTANQLGISQKTLYTKIKKYEIKQE